MANKTPDVLEKLKGSEFGGRNVIVEVTTKPKTRGRSRSKRSFGGGDRNRSNRERSSNSGNRNTSRKDSGRRRRR